MAILLRVRPKTKRMQKVRVMLTETTDPEYADSGIPFEPAEPLSLNFKVDDPDASKRY